MITSINLLSTREQRALRRKRRRVLALAASLCLTGTALGVVNVAQCRHRSGMEADLSALRAESASLRQAAKTAAALEKDIEQQRRRNAAIIGWIEARARPAKALRGLAGAAPETLWLTRYAESDDVTVLEGQATQDASITRFLRNLPGDFVERQLVEAGKAPGDIGFRHFVIHARTTAPPAPAASGE